MPTEAKDIFEAHSRSLRELLSENGLGLYLPPYQRPYGWSKDKVEKLIDDTMHGLMNLGKTADSFTFLGTVITIHDVNHTTVQPVVKTEVPAKVLTVIDGQQRISSLLMLIVCVHNLIRQYHWEVFAGEDPDPEDEPLSNLHEESVVLLRSLGSAFYEKHQIGDSPLYPRLIRAFDDQWAKKVNKRQYTSPISNLLFKYAEIADAEWQSTFKPTDFQPKPRDGVSKGEADLTSRFSEMRAILKRLANNEVIDDIEGVPAITAVAENSEFQKALFSHELEDEFCKYLKRLEEKTQLRLFRLVILGSYILNRIAITVVKGKDEDYAFTIFESLNTTGEPLTAIETFLPRVVMAEGLGEYQDSDAHSSMKVVQGYLAQFQVGEKLQAATRDLLVNFALAESGTKLAKRLADQRVYMKESFERGKDSKPYRDGFLTHLRDTATFLDRTWNADEADRELVGLGNAAMTDDMHLCLSFLKSLKHTITVAPLVRFYSQALAAGSMERAEALRDLESALKAITAFTVYWRSSRRTTGNIDREYREIMAGVGSVTGIDALCRVGNDLKASSHAVSAEQLKNELAARLTSKNHGDLPDRASWLTASSTIPFYTVNRVLTRFLLLAAYHDTVEDLDHPGLVTAGKPNASPCLTAGGWNDEVHLTVEHIAPQSRGTGWSDTLNAKKDTVHQLGNLVLSPAGANSSLSARPWSEKRVLYTALGASSTTAAEKLLKEAQEKGITFAESTSTLASYSRYLPHLSALGMHQGEWDAEFVERRSRSLLELVDLRLSPWLGLDWTEAH